MCGKTTTTTSEQCVVSTCVACNDWLTVFIMIKMSDVVVLMMILDQKVLTKGLSLFYSCFSIIHPAFLRATVPIRSRMAGVPPQSHPITGFRGI